MSDLRSYPVASLAGTDLSLYELLHTLKLQGRLTALIAGAVVEKVIATAAGREGIKVSDEELQRAADDFRQRRGLNKANDTERWLALNRLAPADLEECLERDLVRQKLVDKVTRAHVNKAFAEDRARFDRARLRHIVVDKEGIAQELLTRLHDDGADFAELARQYSIDPRTRAAGGDLGIVPRQGMPPAIAAAVYSARNGAVVGPVKTAAGYVLVKVEEILHGQLDAATTAALQQNLFRKWIAEQVRNCKVEVKLEI